MFVSKTPYRISFAGGGTDLPGWVAKYGGAVISTSIDKYCYISCRKTVSINGFQHSLIYSKAEYVNQVEEIQHHGIRGVFRFLNIETGLAIQHDGDLPARSGLGSSSSFTVGLLNAIKRMQGCQYMPSKLAQDAIYVEQVINKESVGLQDQVAASFGGFNKIVFNKDGSFQVLPLPISHSNLELLQSNLVLFYTGKQRRANDIEKSKISRLPDKAKAYSAISHSTKILESILSNAHLSPSDVGSLLNDGWMLKKELSDMVSCDELDQIYDAAISAGAFGGKLLGAGGGGFFLFVVDPSNRKNLIDSLSGLVPVDFSFENKGSVVFDLTA